MRTFRWELAIFLSGVTTVILQFKSVTACSRRCAYDIAAVKKKLDFNEDQKDEGRPLSELFNLRKLSNIAEPARAIGIIKFPDYRIVQRIEYKDENKREWKHLIQKFGRNNIYPVNHKASIRFVLRPNAYGSTEIKIVAGHLCNNRWKVFRAKNPCEEYQPQKFCHFNCKKIIDLQINVSPTPDRPVAFLPLPFPSVPETIDTTHNAGCKLATLMKVKPYLSNKILNSQKRNVIQDFRKLMSEDDINMKNVMSLLGETVIDSKERYSVEDFDKDQLGLAIVCDSPGLDSKTANNIGKWYYKDQTQNWKLLTDLIQSPAAKQRCKCVITLNPGVRLKFEPNSGIKFWKKTETRIHFYVRKTKDGRPTGGGCVDPTTDKRISEATTHLEVSRLGCDGLPDTKAVKDQCGKCGGNDECVGCDKQVNSNAKKVCGVCYGGKTGRTSPLDQCKNYCSKPSDMNECLKKLCRSLNKPDCHGTCHGKARIDECGECVGGKTGRQWNYLKDACGDCNGNNKSCLDCNGKINGRAKNDECGECHPPDSPKFNSKCKKIVQFKPSTSMEALKTTKIRFMVTGIKKIEKISCELVNKKSSQRFRLNKIGVAPSSSSKPTAGLKGFEAETPSTVAAGQYNLQCTIEPGTHNVHYNKIIHFIEKTQFKCSVAEPNYILMNSKKGAIITIKGLGFVNSGQIFYQLVSVSRRLSKKIRATFESSSSVKCPIPSVSTPVEKICVSLSDQLRCCTDFHLKVLAPRPHSCTVHRNLKSLTIRFNKPVVPTKRRINCEDILNKDICKWIGKIRRRSSRCLILQVKDADKIENGVKISLVHRAFKYPNSKIETVYNSNENTIDVQCKKLRTAIRSVKLVKLGRGCSYTLYVLVKGPGKSTFSWTVSTVTKSSSVPVNRALDDINRKLSKQKKRHLNNLHLDLLPSSVMKIRFSVTVGGKVGKPVTASVLLNTKNTGQQLHITRLTTNKYIILKPKITCSKGKAIDFDWTCDLRGLRFRKTNPKNSILRLKKTEVRRLYQKPFSCTYSNGKTSATKTISLRTGNPLKCYIRGGKGAVVSEKQKILKLSSKADDPDNKKEEMKYSWKCEDSQRKPCVNKDGMTVSLPETPDITMNLTALRKRSNETFNFSLTVSKGNRTKKCSVTRTIQDGNPPICALELPNKFAGVPVDPNDKIWFYGKISSVSDTSNYELQVVDSNTTDSFDIAGEDALLKATPYQGVVKKSKTGGRRSLKFVLNSGALQEKANYLLRLHCWDDKSRSYGDMELQTKSSPSAGAAEVDQANGIAANTTFTISNGEDDADEEEDDETTEKNTRHQCGYYKENRKKNRKEKVYLTESSDTDHCNVKLPAGPKETNYTQEIFIQSCNEEDACSEAKVPVQVKPRSKPVSADDVKKAKEDVKDSMDMCNIQEVKEKITALLETLQEESKSNPNQEVTKETVQLCKTVLQNILECLGEDETDDEKEKNTKLQMIVLALKTVNLRDEIDDLVEKLTEFVLKSARAKKDEEEESSGSRTRRAVSEPTQTVVAKTVQEVESNLYIYHKLIYPYDYSVDMMKNKKNFLDLLNELGRSMCKDKAAGEPAQVAESSSSVLRSEQNTFANVDKNYSLTGCEPCTDYPYNSSRVLLGSSLKESYDDWNCNGDACRGACVVTAQMMYDYLINSSYPKCNRASDVTYVQLFNPETLMAISVSDLAQPTTFQIHIDDAINMASANLECYIWDQTSSSWTTSGASTVSKDDGSRSVQCSANKLGYFAVFDCVADNVTTTTASIITVSSVTQSAYVGSTSTSGQPENAGTTASTSASGQSENAGTTVSTSASGQFENAGTTVSTSASGQTGNDGNTSASGQDGNGGTTVSTPASGKVTIQPTTSREDSSFTSHSHDTATTPTASRKITFSVDANFNDHITSENLEKFETAWKQQIAKKLQINEYRITDVKLNAGSIVVSFVLLSGGRNESDINTLTSKLQTMVENGNLTLTTPDGKNLKVIISSFVQSVVSSITTATPTSKKLIPVGDDESEMQQEVLIGIIAGACMVVMVIIAVALYCRMKSKQKVEDCNDDDHPQKPAADVVNQKVEENSAVSVGDVYSTIPGSPVYDNVT